MATKDRFYPTGYIGTEAAILTIAKARQPERWRPSGMSERERKVWAGINKTFSGFVLDPKLPLSISKADKAAAYVRLQDFNDALIEVRQTLHAGGLVAVFCDELGQVTPIPSAVWGGDLAIDGLLTGVVAVPDTQGFWSRLALLKESDVQGMVDQISGKGDVRLQQRGERASCQSGGVAPYPVTTTASVQKAIGHVKALLLKNEHERKNDTYSSVMQNGEIGHVSKNQFDREVWPAAREAAGLVRKATPGPKRRTVG